MIEKQLYTLSIRLLCSQYKQSLPKLMKLAWCKACLILVYLLKPKKTIKYFFEIYVYNLQHFFGGGGIILGNFIIKNIYN